MLEKSRVGLPDGRAATTAGGIHYRSRASGSPVPGTLGSNSRPGKSGEWPSGLSAEPERLGYLNVLCISRRSGGGFDFVEDLRRRFAGAFALGIFLLLLNPASLVPLVQEPAENR